MPLQLPFDLIISRMGLYPMEISQKAKPNFIRIFIAKPLIIEENWKQPKCPTVRGLAKPRIAYQLSGSPRSH